MADEPVQMPDLPTAITRVTMSKSEMAVSKVFSAQWLMAVGVTLGATIITLIALFRFQEKADTIVTVYFTNWGIIIANYFRRDTSSDSVINSKK